MKILTMHYRGLISALSRIICNPIEHLLNILVIGLISAILGGTYVISQSSDKWHEDSIVFPQIVVYLGESSTQADATKLETIIDSYNSKIIRNYQFISKDEALASLKQDDQLKQIASEVVASNNNPLPNVLLINTNTENSKRLQQLMRKISSLPTVDSVDMDAKYADKISDMVSFIKKVSGFLQILFSIVIALVIYNSIRLQMLIRRDEITVSRLIGASDSFIMRPLAYYAIIQVALGALAAYGFINWFINFLNSLFLSMNNLFGQSFLLKHFSAWQFGQMLLILVIFTIFAVFMAIRWVFRHNSYTTQ